MKNVARDVFFYKNTSTHDTIGLLFMRVDIQNRNNTKNEDTMGKSDVINQLVVSNLNDLF